MNAQEWLLIGVFLIVLLILAKPLGVALARIIDGEPPKALLSIENFAFRFCGIDHRGMNWWQYALSILCFNGLGALLLFGLLMAQQWLPFNPDGLPGLSWDLALNTAISFVTNTNWQAYAGEITVSHFSQMAGLAVQNFLSGATGIAVAFGLIRAFARAETDDIGNAWVDLYRITLYVLLPLSVLLAIFFVSQGVIQNLEPTVVTTGLTGTSQSLPMGPVASQEAIKLLGTNGGGFFNANSSHPFENPTAATNFVQMVSILLIPAALCFAFGRVVGNARQGHTLLAAMVVIFTVATIGVISAEQVGNDKLVSLGADSTINMEGKEARLGIGASGLFATVTTAASCGAVNAMHDSFTPLGGMVPMVLMQTGEIVFGGVGSGLYGILLFVMLAVFIAGLMIGRTPEYLGKKIGAFEMKMTTIAIAIPAATVLLGTTIALLSEAGRAGILNPGAHGFSEVLYAFSSAANNNGSAFAGLSANTVFYNLSLGLAMISGRFGVIIPILAIAGSIVAKKRQPVGQGSLPTTGPLFVGLLIGTIVLLAALTFVPALALGPIAEQLQLTRF